MSPVGLSTPPSGSTVTAHWVGWPSTVTTRRTSSIGGLVEQSHCVGTAAVDQPQLVGLAGPRVGQAIANDDGLVAAG